MRLKGEDVSKIRLPDPSLLNKFENDTYKLAYFQILLPHARAYYKNGLVICSSMRRDTNDLVMDNDTMGEFIHNCIQITQSEKDKISKEEFISRYKMDVDTKIEWSTLLSHAQRSM